MPKTIKIKKKDNVIVLSGRDKGKKGEVHKVFPSKGTALVTGINMVTKHARPSQNKPGGIQKKEMPIAVSKLALVCSKCQKPVRVSVKILNGGEKVRACRKCGEAIV